MPPMTGRVIAGRYNLEHPIGRGAMGVVWRARDQLLDRDVAVKEVVITALISAEERHNAYQRTLREARTAARLSHRGVVAVYDVAEEDGRPWIVMELVPSRSLDQVLTVEGRLSPARTGRIGQQLLSALAAAHAVGVLHRDVKPSNVLIANDRAGDTWDERAVLTDFGIAQFEGDPRLTATGMVMGSPGFTAPERIRGGDATPASDLWSLGATLYAAVEGRGPYEARGGAITTMSAIINEDAPLAPHAGPLGPLIAALLRREPATRPSASAAARMFAEVQPRLAEPAELPAAAHPPTVSAFSPARMPAGEVTVPADDNEPVPAVAAPDDQDESVAKPDEAAAEPDEITPAGVTAVESARPPASDRQPGKLAVPVAREETTAPAEPASAKPKPSQPTFTAAKATERVSPTFSAASPVRPQPARPYIPQPQPQPYAGHGAGSAEASYRDDGTTPYQAAAGPYGSGSASGSGGGQYAGPSQQSPDLSRQYPLGASGGASRRGRRRRRVIVWLAALVVLAAAIGVGTWLGLKGGSGGNTPSADPSSVADTQTDFGSVNALNDPASALPAGFTRHTVTAAEAGSKAGFSIAVPSTFKESSPGPSTFFVGPNHMKIQIDLTPHHNTTMTTEARYLAANEAFADYKLKAIAAVPVLHTAGAIWQFDFFKEDTSLIGDDILFISPVKGGAQSYAIFIRGPSSNWGKTYLPQFKDMLRTFRIVQGS